MPKYNTYFRSVLIGSAEMENVRRGYNIIVGCTQVNVDTVWKGLLKSRIVFVDENLFQ